MNSSRMPLPVWDPFSFETVSVTSTVLSDDIWKKFDLDDLGGYRDCALMEDPIAAISSPVPQQHCEVPMMMNFDKLHCQASREIRHHDCMWAGLCISKEHNRTHPAKKDPKIQRRIPAGRSLLIPKNLQQQQLQLQQQQPQTSLLQHQHNSNIISNSSSNSLAHINGFAMCRPASSLTTTKNLESDGDSTRPETPQSSNESEYDEELEEEEEEDEEEEDEEEDEVPVFKHEQISINDIVPVNELTGQHIQRRTALYDRRKAEETSIRNTLMSDHCYHLNQQQPSSKAKNLEHLGVQTPSDSEEEIDVVSWDKPTRPINTATGLSLPTYPSPAEHQRLQHTVNTAFKERHAASKLSAQSQIAAQQSLLAAAQVAIPATPAPRPRGRPPSNSTVASRKRAAAAAALEQAKASAAAVSSSKRAKQSNQTARTYNRRQQQQQQQQQHIAGSTGSCSAKSSPQSSPGKLNSSRTNSSSDDEPDTEKRSLHNNMERQRRIELRNAFEDLRLLVPEVEAKEKAPKVAILRQAALYCDKLTDQEHLHLSKIADLRRKQDRLKAQLGYLRRSLAMMR